MTNAELKQFYEKLYFLELEARDKINARLQLSLTLLLAVVGVVIFLLQNLDHQSSWSPTWTTFTFFFAGGIAILIVAVASFVKAFWNHEYHFLPASQKTAEYKVLLENTYEQYDGREQLVSAALEKYLVTYYVEYATFNTQVNDRRSSYIHNCNGATIGAALLFMAAYVVFYSGGLDKSKIRSATEVFVTKPLDVRIQDDRK